MHRSEETTPSRGLAGWSAVEDYMQGHDGGRMKDHADDVDALLVFAGLFSAVLSAFLVVTFTLLQSDNSQTTVALLTRITMQLDNILDPQHQALQPLPDTSSFRPTTASLWVNSLWFVSLVLSLSAAFFGILVKQWIREYMRWNSPLADPKENVLVRQIRFEAWQDWSVDTSILYIPVLLELSLVLFFAGLEALLWSVETTVAVVITIFVSLFFGCATAATLLPLFMRRCPYKSPTSYGILLLYHLGKRYIGSFVTLVKKVTRMRPSTSWEDDACGSRATLQNVQLDWRLRDIQDSTLRSLRDSTGMSKDASVVFTNELQVHLTGSGYDIQDALLEMGKSEILLHALSWVAQASQEKRVLANVATSAENLHATDLPYDIRYLSTVHILSNRLGDEGAYSRGASSDAGWLPAVPEYALPQLDGTMHTLLSVLRQCYHAPETRGRVQEDELRAAPQEGFGFLERTWHAKHDWFCAARELPVFVRLLAGGVQGTVRELVRLTRRRAPRAEPVAIGARAMGLLCAFHRLVRAAQLRWPERQAELLADALAPLVDSYNAIVGDVQADRIDELWCPGLRTSLLATICSFGKVRCASDGRLVRDHSSSSEASAASIAAANLVVSYRDATAGTPYGREDCSCLVSITNSFLSTLVSVNVASDAENDWQNVYVTPDRMQAIVDTMIAVAQTALERGYTNCGSYTRLPWLSAFTLRSFWLIAPRQLGQLIDILEQCDAQGLLTQEVTTRLAHARGVVAYFENDPGTVWEKGAARELQNSTPLRPRAATADDHLGTLTFPPTSDHESPILLGQSSTLNN